MRRLLHFLPLSMLLGCGPQAGGQVGEETVQCKAVDTVALALDEESPLGFSGEEVIAALAEPPSVDAMWIDDTSANADIHVTYDGGAIAFEDREWQNDTGEAIALETGCDDVVAIEVTLSIVTDDGRLDESLATAIDATGPLQASAYPVLEGALQGTLDPQALVPNATLDAGLSVNVQWQSGAPEGTLTASASDDTTAEQFILATFGDLR